VTRGVVVLSVATIFVVALQVAIVSPLRVWGVVVMVVWLWPLVLGLTSSTLVAVSAGFVTGLLFDAHTVTPFGLTGVIGALLAWFISLLAREGVGDLDSAAWWVPALLVGAGGTGGPGHVRAGWRRYGPLRVVAGQCDTHDVAELCGLFRTGETVRSGSAAHCQRGGVGPRMSRNRNWRDRHWRDRPALGRRFLSRWRPWTALRPSRHGVGSRINVQKSVGLRDLVAAPGEVGSRPEIRWRVIGSFFVVLMSLVIVRLVFLQVIEHAAAVSAVNSNSLRVSSIPAERGQIRDRNGNVLVGNRLTTQLQLSRAQAALQPEVKGALAALTGLTVAEIDAKLSSVQYLPYQPIPILTETPPAIIEYVKLHPSEFPGVLLVNASTRYYPFGGSLAPHVVGYVGPITGAEIAANARAGYQPNSIYGQSGTELYYESELRGIDGSETFRVDSTGNVIGTTKIVEPKVGESVVLNIDAGLQNAVDVALNAGITRVRTHKDPRDGVYPKAPNGAAIVMDPRNGDVLAMASFPGYNVANFVGGLSVQQYDVLKKNDGFYNNAIQGLYTPGSTFKMISATAQLQTGVLAADQYINDTGTYRVPGCLQGGHGCVFHDDETTGSGEVNLPLALTRSSDYYFYNLGYLFWASRDKYGQTPIQNVAAQYGLGELTGVDLPSEVQGRVDSPQERKVLYAEAPTAFPNFNWYTGDNVEMAFGQGATVVTPLEMADAYATFANGGTRYAPELAAGIVSATGKVILKYPPRVIDKVSLPPNVRGPILQGLVGVVNNSTGTGYQPFHSYATFNLNQFVVAGKTGTASNSAGQEPNSWFVGFGPASAPKYVVLCVIGQGGYGADGAAPVVAQIFNYLVRHPVGPVNYTAMHTTKLAPTGQ
jgi:penicillin-binding protein 2